jgi:hypothetical protein
MSVSCVRCNEKKEEETIVCMNQGIVQYIPLPT